MSFGGRRLADAGVETATKRLHDLQLAPVAFDHRGHVFCRAKGRVDDIGRQAARLGFVARTGESGIERRSTRGQRPGWEAEASAVLAPRRFLGTFTDTLRFNTSQDAVQALESYRLK